MIEKYLIEHCSPTLASIKTASLFSIKYSSETELQKAIEYWNLSFSDKGVELITLKKSEGCALIYVCRKNKLSEDLNKIGVLEFLKNYGYKSADVDECIESLKLRLQSGDKFPHEIGIFLSYPLGDVIGFIENAGQNSKCSGCWKVYCNECEAVKAFAKYKKCKDVYMRLWKQGRSVQQLTVAA